MEHNDDVITEVEFDKRLKSIEARKRTLKNKNKPPARPKVTPETDFPNGWEEDILDLFRQGGFDADARIWFRENSQWAMHPNTFTKLLANNDHFRDIILYGRDLSYQWWIKLAKDHMTKRDFNSASWSKIMVNIFKWKDVVSEIDIDSTIRKTKYDDMDAKDLLSNLTEKLNEGK